MNLSTLKQLQKRIREATGPDRELDAEITVALTPTKETADDLIYLIVPRREDYCTLGTYWRKSRSGASLHTAPLLTTYPDGLGACVGLMHATLPGWSWQVGAYPQVHAHVAEPVMTKYGPGIGVRAQTSGATVSLAMLDAIISARIAELEAEQVKEGV